MLERLKELLNKTYVPSSNFKVASIIIDNNGNEHEGVNLEYAIPTNSICAERNAISTAITNGMKFGDLKEVHVYAESMNNFDPELFTPPCGACRQAILEASNGNAKVFLYNSKGEVKESTIKDLLPLAFTGGEI